MELAVCRRHVNTDPGAVEEFPVAFGGAPAVVNAQSTWLATGGVGPWSRSCGLNALSSRPEPDHDSGE